jgi:endonuclease III
VPFPDLRALRDFYGLLPQPPADPFQFFLWEILSTDAVPARRDLAWHSLRRIPALTPDAVFRTPVKELVETLDLIGPRRDERLDRIRQTTGAFKRHREALGEERLRTGGLLRARRALRGLAHLPRETLDLALLYVAGYAVLPLDDATARVVARLEGTAIPAGEGAEGVTLERARSILRLAVARSPLDSARGDPEPVVGSGQAQGLRRQRRRARKVLAAALPRDVDAYRETVLYARHHAHHTCSAVGPHCGVCPLLSVCVFGRQTRSRTVAVAGE